MAHVLFRYGRRNCHHQSNLGGSTGLNCKLTHSDGIRRRERSLAFRTAASPEGSERLDSRAESDDIPDELPVVFDPDDLGAHVVADAPPLQHPSSSVQAKATPKPAQSFSLVAPVQQGRGSRRRGRGRPKKAGVELVPGRALEGTRGLREQNQRATTSPSLVQRHAEEPQSAAQVWAPHGAQGNARDMAMVPHSEEGLGMPSVTESFAERASDCDAVMAAIVAAKSEPRT